MDIVPDDVKISLSQRPFAIPSSPKSTGSSASSSPGWSNFSFDCQPSQRSCTSSTTSLEGENGQNEEDVAYFSDADVPAVVKDYYGSGRAGQSGNHATGPVRVPDTHDDTLQKLLSSKVGACPVPPMNRQTVQLRNQAQDNITSCPVPLSSRQNPRRTQRQSNGSQSRPPPQLVRQSERKDTFVDSLVGELEIMDKVCDPMLTTSAITDTTTQTIETIWPLSIAQGNSGADQNLIDLRTFVQAVLKRSKTSYSSLIVAIYYLILVMPALPKHDFTMPQSIDSFSCRAMQCGRRMFLAALILASKYLQDRNYSTRAWGKISGLKAVEINANERVFLKAVNWKLHVPEALFQRWERIVLNYPPSGPAVTPRSSPATHQPWKSIFHQLNAELDQFNANGILISDNDSGYYSESSAGSSRGTSPHSARDLSTTPVQMDFVETGTAPPLPELPPLVMEPTPFEVDHRMLPPLKPREGPLPTPQITPQTRNFCAPAVSASGLLPRRSSMSIAMAEHRKCLGEQLLDRPMSWGPTSDSSSHRPFSRAPSSLSISTSSDYFMSDVSRYPSRSSSISSVASSNCALPEPDLASEAVRRCANMKMSALTDKYRPSQLGKVTDTAEFARFPVSPSSWGEDFYFKERPKPPRGETMQNVKRDVLSPELKVEVDSNATTSRHANKPMDFVAWLTPGMNPQNENRLSDDDENSTPKPKPAKIATPTSQTYQAAAALVDLTLDRNSIPKPLKDTPRVNSLKRGRTLSNNRGLQSATQTLIQQHSLSDANLDDNLDAIVIIPDDAVADSWLLKSNQGLNNDLWADFRRRQIDSEDASKNREVARKLMEQHTQESLQSASDAFEFQPRKKACCHSSRSNPKQGQKSTHSRKSSAEGTTTPKAARKTSGTHTKIRGPRKPDAELDRMCRDAPAEYAELQTIKDLLYGEIL